MARARAAQYAARSVDFTFINNFFATGFAANPNTRPAHKLSRRYFQLHWLYTQHLIIGHALVPQELRKIVPFLARRILPGAFANIRLGSDPQRPAGFCINEGGRNLTVIIDAQRPLTDMHLADHLHTISKTAVRF